MPFEVDRSLDWQSRVQLSAVSLDFILLRAFIDNPTKGCGLARHYIVVKNCIPSG